MYCLWLRAPILCYSSTGTPNLRWISHWIIWRHPRTSISERCLLAPWSRQPFTSLSAVLCANPVEVGCFAPRHLLKPLAQLVGLCRRSLYPATQMRPVSVEQLPPQFPIGAKWTRQPGPSLQQGRHPELASRSVGQRSPSDFHRRGLYSGCR